jgi:hypothetical protein
MVEMSDCERFGQICNDWLKAAKDDTNEEEYKEDN